MKWVIKYCDEKNTAKKTAPIAPKIANEFGRVPVRKTVKPNKAAKDVAIAAISIEIALGVAIFITIPLISE